MAISGNRVVVEPVCPLVHDNGTSKAELLRLREVPNSVTPQGVEHCVPWAIQCKSTSPGKRNWSGAYCGRTEAPLPNRDDGASP
jgi:hypothetical protein